MTKKSNSATITQRVTTTYTFLLSGMSRRQIVDYCRKVWKIKRAQADVYIKKARDLIRIDAEHDRDQELAIANRRFHDIYSRAITAGNLKAALEAQRSLCDLYGLNEAARIKIEGNLLGDGNLSSLTDAQLEKVIADGSDSETKIKKKSGKRRRSNTVKKAKSSKKAN